jgi:outer membrane protein assembly factor BamA
MHHRLRFLTPVFAGGALLLLGQSAAAQSRHPDETTHPEVKSLVIRGVKNVDVDELKTSIATHESRCRTFLLVPICAMTHSDIVFEHNYLDPAEFQRDLLRIKIFYWKRGYRATRVDTAVTRGDPVTVTFRIYEGAPTLVEKITVLRPDSVLTNKQIRRLMLLRAGRPLNVLTLDSSTVRLRDALWELGYGDAALATEASPADSAHPATVTVTIDPKPKTTVGEIRIVGNTHVSDRIIRNSLSFHEGDLYRLNDVAKSQRELYESSLFRRASITVVSDTDTVLTTASGNVVTGPPGSPVHALAGGARPDSVVADTGAGVNAAHAKSDTIRVGAGGSTTETKGEFVDSGDSSKIVEIRVMEAPARSARVSGGFNTYDYVQFEGRFTHYNWLGGARRLDITGAIGNLLSQQLNGTHLFKDPFKDVGDRARYFAPTWQASADVKQRWFQNPNNQLGFSVFGHRRSTPGIFVDKGVGTSATFTREFGLRPAPVSANYRYELTGVEAGDVYFCVNFGVCERNTIDALARRQALSPVSLTATIARANDPFEPSRGFNAQASVEHASAFTLSDFRYNRAFAEGAIYRRMGRRNIVAGRLRMGWVNALASTEQATGAEGFGGQILHPRKRFYAGGSQSVRGYGENQLGPRVLTISAKALRGEGKDSLGNATFKCPPSIAIQNCDPNAVAADGSPLYKDRDFTARPVGGNALVEGSLELRFPIWRRDLLAAFFVDGALVGEGTLKNVTQGTGAFTPGVGIRYRSPVGPIRVDVGYRPFLAEDLAVITESTTASGKCLVELDRGTTVSDPCNAAQANAATKDIVKRRYNPGADAGGIKGWLNHLTLHLSIGEAF